MAGMPGSDSRVEEVGRERGREGGRERPVLLQGRRAGMGKERKGQEAVIGPCSTEDVGWESRFVAPLVPALPLPFSSQSSHCTDFGGE